MGRHSLFARLYNFGSVIRTTVKEVHEAIVDGVVDRIWTNFDRDLVNLNKPGYWFNTCLRLFRSWLVLSQSRFWATKPRIDNSASKLNLRSDLPTKSNPYNLSSIGSYMLMFQESKNGYSQLVALR